MLNGRYYVLLRQAPENERAAWDPEWVRAYARLEEEYRQRDESESPNAGLFGSRTSAKDPRYALQPAKLTHVPQQLALSCWLSLLYDAHAWVLYMCTV